MPLHPQVKDFLDGLAKQKAPGWHEMTPKEGREVFASLTALFGVGPQIRRVEDRMTDAGIALRIYSPDALKPQPVMMYFHGGGWVLGDLDTHDALCRRLAIESSSTVVAVDYRRAPEHKFPAALDDCFAATKFVADQADQLGLDAKCLLVAGDSVGGNLAAAVALRARDEGGPTIHSQLLIYPVIEPRFDSNSYVEFAEGFGLTKATMMWFWEQYLGSDLDRAGEYAIPSRATYMKSLPPAHVVTAEFDVLRDEGEAFAKRLANAGVPMTARRYDGMIHGFVHFSAAFDAGLQALSDVAKIVKETTVE